ncbi:Lysophosphatidic acid receptor 4 [Oryzias melastigma]|uniref:Lysophosphatidic acid receptor 4 n=1 Tax=Oryzias melastigma TaxID=30732 RepID=A0A834BUZ8_ORYME|nr:Lysophosphatidic acid receptor 4 [Oryzias melastigma]
MASLVINETGMENCGIDDSFKYDLYSAVYSVVFILGLITNCAALFVFCFRMKISNETTMFMTNLAFSDLVFVFTLPFKVFYNVNRNWPFGDGLCKVSGTAFITNIYWQHALPHLHQRGPLLGYSVPVPIPLHPHA